MRAHAACEEAGLVYLAQNGEVADDVQSLGLAVAHAVCSTRWGNEESRDLAQLLVRRHEQLQGAGAFHAFHCLERSHVLQDLRIVRVPRGHVLNYNSTAFGSSA
eukprot:6212142-Pleurochrysis_carterae.AAC.2